MKKIAAFVIALAMLITGAYAESIFPTLSSDASDAVTAISFGSVSGMLPASNQILPNGSTCQVYTGVTVEQYNAFGTALGCEGYTLASQNAVDGGVELQVVNGIISLDISYSMDSGTLSVTYPAGVTPEKAVPNLFPGYETIEFGETITIKSYGSITLGDMTFDGNAAPIKHLGLGIMSEYAFCDNASVYFTGAFSNTTPGDIRYHDIMYCTMYYITDEYTYEYPMHYIAQENDDGTIYLGSEDRSGGVNFNLVTGANYPFNLIGPSVESLESGDFACVFRDIPELVRNTEDGVVAITIEMPGYEGGYVVYVRY